MPACESQHARRAPTRQRAAADRERVQVTIVRLPAGRFRLVEQTARGAGAFGAGDTIHYRPIPAADWDG